MIKDKIAEIEKGCKILFGDCIYKDMNPKPCGIVFKGELRLCSNCRDKLKATKSTAKELIDDEIEFLEFHKKLCSDRLGISQRLNLLQKQRSKLK